MNPRDLITRMQDAITTAAIESAMSNGASRDRTLDQYRFVAGEVSGLRKAVQMIEDEFKKMLESDE